MVLANDRDGGGSGVIFKLLQVEVLKIRRSLALLMMLACPLVVVVMVIGMTLRNTPLTAFNVTVWGQVQLGITALWSYFMLPLYVALATSLVNGNEHRNQTWRLMLTLPINQHQLFFAKALVAWLLIVGSNMALMVFVAIAILLVGAAGYPVEGALGNDLALLMLKIPIACLPILVVQHAISWRFGNIVLPLAVGVIATMGIIQVGSSQYWVYYPWSYVLMSANGSSPLNQQHALLLAVGIGLVLYGLSTVWLGRREVV